MPRIPLVGRAQGSRKDIGSELDAIPRLRADARGRDGGVRQRLAAAVAAMRMRELRPSAGNETREDRAPAWRGTSASDCWAQVRRRGPRCLVASPQMIEAPHAASRHCEIEEHEAVDNSQLTHVQEWKEAPRRVRYEVCDGHVAC